MISGTERYDKNDYKYISKHAFIFKINFEKMTPSQKSAADYVIKKLSKRPWPLFSIHWRPHIDTVLANNVPWCQFIKLLFHCYRKP
jgi:hypothetical protein